MKLHLKTIAAVVLATGVSFLTGCDFVPWTNARPYIKMVRVVGGTVPLTDTYKPTVSSFRMSETEITQKQWRQVVGNDGYGTTPSDRYGKGLDFPMYYVSWYDALVFCNKLSLAEGKTPCYTIKSSTNPDDWGAPPSSSAAAWDNATCDWSANGYRLPTEAEWEYAARGGSANTYTIYSGTAGYTEDDLKTVAWYDGNSGNKLHEVNTKPNANPIKDMSGNVWEWCWDRYGSSYNTSQTTDPTGATSGSSRVSRGGSWYYSASNCTVSIRGDSYNFSPYNRRTDCGFRVVCRP